MSELNSRIEELRQQALEKVRSEEFDDALVLPQRERGGIGAEDDVLELPQRARRGQGLLGEHVERRARELAAR